MSNRKQEINDAIVKLKSFKTDPRFVNDAYAIEQNIKFLNSIKTIFGYIYWLVNDTKKISSERLMELTDFPVKEWDIKMHKRLIEIERNKHIGLGKPLVDSIEKFILQQNKPTTLVNLGAGGMEVDRQVIERLLQKKHRLPAVFIGVDKSEVTHQIAKENFQSLAKDIKIIEVEQLDMRTLLRLQETNKGIVVILCKNDIFELNQKFSPKTFDLMYHSLFKHHISDELQVLLDSIIGSISKNWIEYDGYRTWRVIVPQTVVAWNHPFFLSATVLSNLRFKTREEVVLLQKQDRLSFFKSTGHYLLEHYEQ
jgi:hypothetical protein